MTVQDRQSVLEKFLSTTNRAPYYKTISMDVMSYDRKGAVMRIRIGRKHINPFGTVHGGAMASLIDSVGGFAVKPHLKDGGEPIAVSLHIDFIAPVLKGDIIACAKVVHLGRRLARTEAVITDENHKMVAKGTVVYIIAKNQNG